MTKLLSWISEGVFDQNLKELGYDRAFHLFIYVLLQNGTALRMEKDQVVRIETTQWNAQGDNVETMPGGSINVTLSEFLEKGIKKVGEQQYFVYDAITQNCQAWVRANLSANGLWNDSISKFVMQDSKSIFKNLGLLEKVGKVASDVAHVADVAMNGGRKKKKKKM